MDINEAIRARITELCGRQKISKYTLALGSGLSPSTVKSIFSKSNNIGIHTIKRITEGLNISTREFFESDLFDDLDWEEDSDN